MIRLIISIVFFLILAVFIALNAQNTTDINFFGYQLEGISVVSVIIITMAVGILYSFVLYITSYLTKSRQQKIKREKDRNKKQAEQLKEQKSLREPPSEQKHQKASGSNKKSGKKSRPQLLSRKKKKKPTGDSAASAGKNDPETDTDPDIEYTG